MIDQKFPLQLLKCLCILVVVVLTEKHQNNISSHVTWRFALNDNKRCIAKVSVTEKREHLEEKRQRDEWSLVHSTGWQFEAGCQPPLPPLFDFHDISFFFGLMMKKVSFVRGSSQRAPR